MSSKPRSGLESQSIGSILEHNSNAFGFAASSNKRKTTSSAFLDLHSKSTTSSPAVGQFEATKTLVSFDGGDLLPEFDGHPLENSLLHDVDESLTHASNVYDNEDAELEFESHNENVGWKHSFGNSSSADGVNKRSSGNKKPRAVDPAKQKLLDEAASDLAMKRTVKFAEMKAKRDDVIFQRRKLELQNQQQDTEVEEIGDGGVTRKRRMTSGLSAHYQNFYGENLTVNNQLTIRNDEDLISGTAAAILGLQIFN